MSVAENCRLCHNVIRGKQFKVIDSSTKDILDVLLVKLDLHENEKHVICSVCFKKLLEAFNFKSTCLQTENTIMSSIKGEELLQKDIQEVYLKENELGRTDNLSQNQKICRLCLQLSGYDFSSLQEMNLDMLQKFIPEMNLDIVKEPIVCNSCSISFEACNSFLKTCLQIENKEVRPLFDCSIETEGMNLKCEEEFSIDADIKMEKVEEILIKSEEIDIKVEAEEQESYVLPSANCESEVLDDLDPLAIPSDEKKPKSNCPTKNKDITKVQMYQCDVCDFETKHIGHLRRHKLKHKKIPNLQIYMCHSCDYKTRSIAHFKRHTLQHSSSSELEIYRCHSCDFETKHMTHFQSHCLIHKIPEVEIYKCDICNFETECKSELKKHEIKHRNPSDLKMFRCEICYYETRYKKGYKNHLEIHKNPTELQMFQCDTCGLQTMHRKSYKNHLLLHKSPSEVQMYKCDCCNFQTRYKASLQKHSAKH